jgi:WD40 repeat protein
VRAAALVAAGKAIAAQGVMLVEAMAPAMLPARFKSPVLLFLAAATLAAGTSVLACRLSKSRQAQAQEAAPAKAITVDQPGFTPQHGRTDLYGDPLPPGALARMGTVRWRHVRGIADFTFSRDGRIVASSGWEDGTIQFWEVSTGRERLRIYTGKYGIGALALSPNGSILASTAAPRYAPEAPGWVDFWDFATGRHLLKIEKERWRPTAVAFAPNGKTLATAAGDSGIHLWDAMTGKERLHIPAQSAYAVLFFPSGQALASSDDKGIRLWDMATGRELRKLEGEAYRDLTQFAISPDGKTVAAVAQWGPPQAKSEKQVVLWDAATGKKWLHFKFAPQRRVFAGGAVAFSPNGKTLAASGNDGTITLWDLVTAKQKLLIQGASDQVWRLAFSPDGNTLAGGYWSKTICLWDVATGRQIIKPADAHRNDITQVTFTPDGKELVTASDDATVRLWEARTGRQRLALGGHDFWVRAIAVSADGKTLASSGLDDTVRLWDLASGKELHRFPGHGNSGGSRSLAFSSDGGQLVSWGDDRELRVWEVSGGREVLNCQPEMTARWSRSVVATSCRSWSRKSYRTRSTSIPPGNSRRAAPTPATGLDKPCSATCPIEAPGARFTELAAKGADNELGGDPMHPGREFGSRSRPPLALLVATKVLPAMQESAAEVEPMGVEGGVDLPEMWLPDQPLASATGAKGRWPGSGRIAAVVGT